MKLLTMIGTRPEIIKLSEIIRKCDTCFEHILAHTGQNYDYSLNEIFFEDLGLRKPDHFLGVAAENLGHTIGNVIANSYDLLAAEMPDALLILGDTNSCLCAISAKRLKIPVFHLEAGNRCFDENLPEEVNRRIIDHTSDVNLAYSEHARRNLLAEGLPARQTFVVGSPMAEVLAANAEKIENSTVLEREGLHKKGYFLLSAHREENLDHEGHFRSLMNSVNVLADRYQVPIIYSTHPRSAKKLMASGFSFHPLVRSMPPYSFSDYVQLQKNALCVISDSGTLAEEASWFKFPAVSVRTSTERPEAMEKGNFIIGSIDASHVLEAVAMATHMDTDNALGAPVPDYADDNVSTKVAKIIQSYVPIINNFVWRKPAA